MTARTGTTYAPHASRERGLLTIALAVACALHAIALLMPLPEKPRAALMAPPDRMPPELSVAPIPPPRVPELPAASRDRPLVNPLVAVRSVPEVDPVVEPQWSPPIRNSADDLPQPAFSYPVAPPPAEAALPEGTPGLTLPRQVSGCGEPVYPEIARRAGVGGIVFLRALIDEEGEVSTVDVLQEPSLDLGFAEAAVAAVSCRRYEPGLHGGRPVAVILTVVVEFEVR